MMHRIRGVARKRYPISFGHAAIFAILASFSLQTVSFGEDRVILPDSIKPLTGIAGREALTETDNASSMDFMISLKMRNLDQLQARIAKGEIVAPAEMAAKYYPLAKDYAALSDWLASNGFTVTETDPARLGIFARGTVQQVQQAFQVTFAKVPANGVTFISASTAPSLPASVAAPVLGVNGLQPHLQKHVHSRIMPALKTPLFANNPPFYPSEILRAYNANALTVSGAGQQIGIVIDTPPKTTDLTNFWTTTGVTQSLNNISFIQVVAGNNAAPSGEESLDTEWSSSIAPNAKVRVYVTRSLSDMNLDAAYQQIIADLPTTPGLNQISLSFGGNETQTSPAQMNTDAQYFATMAGAGVTVFASSGDDGSKPNGVLQISSPSNDPSVTAVGGTSLFLSSTGNVTSETVWSGSGGGTSAIFARPAWQAGNGVPPGAFRLNPDISSAADPNTGSLVILNGRQQTIGGTSWSAPTWAGFCALINEARGKAGMAPIGILGAKIYPLIGTPSFRDITSGSNGDFNAAAGFDECTGIGTPNIANLINALTSNGVAPNLPTITSFFPASGPVGTTVTINGTNFIGPITVTFNGVAAQGLFNGTQAVYQVPAGATTGTIAITTPNGTATSLSSFTVTAGDVSNLPNLVPFMPAGWTDKIVVSTQAGSTLDSRLTPVDALFVRFAVANIGSVSVGSTAAIEVSVDGVVKQTLQTTVPFGGNTTQTFANIAVGLLPLGGHTVTVKVDAANAIAESNESDNSYTKNISVLPPLPNATVLATTATADANAKTSGLLTVSLSSVQSADVAVNFTMGGTAAAGTDYTIPGMSLTIPAGKTSATIAVTPLFNASAVSNSTATVMLSLGTDYVPGTPSSATVTIKNIPPPLVVISAAAASPNPAMAGETVSFSAALSTVTGDTVAYSWALGDGTSKQGTSVTNAYAAPGVYNVVLTATDGKLVSTSTIALTVTALPMQISKVALKFTFSSGRDSLMVTGTLPVGAGYTPAGDTVVVTIGGSGGAGGFQASFPLNAHGSSSGPGLSLALRGRMQAGVFSVPDVGFTLRLTNQGLFDAFNPSPGFSETQSQQGVVLPILFTFNNTAFVGSPAINYITNGRVGTAK